MFSVEVDPGVKLLLKAVVDQDLGEKENDDDLDPQTHFVNIRIKESSEEFNANREMVKDVSDLL